MGEEKKVDVQLLEREPIFTALSLLQNAMHPCESQIELELWRREAMLFEIIMNDVSVGFMVVRFEGLEMVLVAGARHNKSFNIMAYLELIKALKIWAGNSNITLRAHTTKKGVARWLLNQGFKKAWVEEDGLCVAYRWQYGQ